MPAIDFWFDFASTYSYLSAMRIDDAAAPLGVHVRWRPFLLGPIFKSQGWPTSPFNVYPAKGRYMVRDISRIAAERGLAFHLPEPFPQNSLLAARMALALPDLARARFCRAVFAAQFGPPRMPISEPTELAALAFACGADGAATLARADSEAIKTQLRAETAEAERLSIFGAPTFLAADGELFWGDDRLDTALAWARRKS